MTQRTANSAGSPLVFVRISCFGDNPVKYTDPDGKYLINNIAGDVEGDDGITYSARDYARLAPNGIFAFSFSSTILGMDEDGKIMPVFFTGKGNIVFENGMSSKLALVENMRKNGGKTISTSVIASAKRMDNGIYEINLQVSITQINPITGETTVDKTDATIAFASHAELLVTPFGIDHSRVNQIANQVLKDAKFNIKADEEQ